MGNLAIHWFIEASYEKNNDWPQSKKVRSETILQLWFDDPVILCKYSIAPEQGSCLTCGREKGLGPVREEVVQPHSACWPTVPSHREPMHADSMCCNNVQLSIICFALLCVTRAEYADTVFPARVRELNKPCELNSRKQKSWSSTGLNPADDPESLDGQVQVLGGERQGTPAS